MNAHNHATEHDKYPAPVQVWIDDTGNKYAAQELTPGKVGFYVYRTSSKDSYGVTYQAADQYAIQPNPPIRFTVDYALSNHYFHADDLSWIESRELSEAAIGQDPQPVRTLATAISYPDRCQLDEQTIDEIIVLLGHRCRTETRDTIRRRLQSPGTLRNYGLYDRLQISPTVRYCAGQDYPGEIRTIRELLIKN